MGQENDGDQDADNFVAAHVGHGAGWRFRYHPRTSKGTVHHRVTCRRRFQWTALTGYENLLIFAELYDIRRQKRETRVQEALTFMGLIETAAIGR